MAASAPSRARAPAAPAADARPSSPATRSQFTGITRSKGHNIVCLTWRSHTYMSSAAVEMDEATTAACADVARITLRGKQAAEARSHLRGLNFPPDGPAPNEYVTTLLAASPEDDARWLAPPPRSGEPCLAHATAAMHAAIAAYLTHLGHPSAAAAWAQVARVRL